MTYTFLIGSGFSVPIGLPTGGELNERITNAEQLPIGFHTSGALVINRDGTKPDFGFTTSYEATFLFGMRLIKHYCQTHDVFDYEEFFDYFNDIHKRAEKKVQEQELQELYPLLPPQGYYAREEKEDRRGLELYHQTYQLNHIYQELINYLLILPEDIDFAPYESFARSIKELVQQGNIVNIYSLNHDVLIEKIIKHFHLESYFCDGFTNADTAYFGDVSGTKQPLEYFANLYDKPIRLHKLHGSTSYYAFYKEIEAGSYKVSNIIKRPWGLDEFKLEYREGTKVVAGKTSRGMLSMEADFLTGATAKVYRYESPIYYKPQFDNFEADLAITNHLTVIGYGFKDFRVNEIVQRHINANANSIVVDPFIRGNAEAETNKILPNLQILRQGIDKVQITINIYMENIATYINRRINSILDNGILRNVVIDCIIVTEEVDKTLNKEGLILERKDYFTPVPGLKHYGYRIDKQLGDGGPGRQRHIHGYYDGKEFFAMNVDGTAHDGYHQVEIPKELNPFLLKKGFPIPPNNIIEYRQYDSKGLLLCEDVNDTTYVDEAFNAAIGNIRRITIFEVNVAKYQVIMNLQIRNKYEHIEKLIDVPQDRLSEVKRTLVNLLKSTEKYADDVNDIVDASYAKRSLYVAWNNKK